MGDAREKLKREGETLLLRFGDIDIPLPKLEAPSPELAAKQHVRSFTTLAAVAVNACYPQGMERKESRQWAAWQDVLEDEPEETQVTRGMLEWLAKRLQDAKLPPVYSSIRERVTDFLDDMVKNGPPSE